MANICSCYMTITGNKESINDLRKKIVVQDEKVLDKLFTWFVSTNNTSHWYGMISDPEDFEFEKSELYIDFTCKWSPPEADLISLSKVYSKLHFNIRYEEPATALYGLLNFHDGQLLEYTSMSEEEYLENYDEEYIEKIGYIEEMDYDEFIKNLSDIDRLEDISETCRFPGLIEKKYLAKIKDNDLPLLVGRRWYDKENQKALNLRLRGTPK
jgi:hypothetical protein